VLGYTAGGSLIFYTFTTYMQKYLVNTAGMTRQDRQLRDDRRTVPVHVLQPVFGMLSDRIGRRNSMLLFGAPGHAVHRAAADGAEDREQPVHGLRADHPGAGIVSFYTSISGLVKAEMFPPQVRALGVGLAYAVANAVFGGSAEYVALGLKTLGMENTFYWYVTAMMAVAFLFSLRLPKQAAYLHDDH
jgi:MHS family dicarboxylic acid transporter PcaT-like MFS transporter